MDRHQAEQIVEVVQAAWDWVMEPQTFEVWAAATCGLRDAEIAEQAVIELFNHQARKPRFSEVREAYEAIARREKKPVDDAPQLQAPAAPPKAKPELVALVSNLRRDGVEGPELVREVLARKGVVPGQREDVLGDDAKEAS